MGRTSLPLLLGGEEDGQAEDAEQPDLDADGPPHRLAAPASARPRGACAAKAACLGLASAAALLAGAAALCAGPRPWRGGTRQASQIDGDSVVALHAESPAPAPHPVSIDELKHDKGFSEPSPSSPGPAPSEPKVVHGKGSHVTAATSCGNLDDITIGEGKLKGSADACRSWCQSVGGCVGFQFQAEEDCPQLTGEPTLLGAGACFLLLGACEEQPSSCWEVHTVSDGKEPWWKLKGEDTWCSNWEELSIGAIEDGASNQNDCGSQCSQRSDCTGFAYQKESCKDHRDGTVRDHTCALFGRGKCIQVADQCWDFYNMSNKPSLPSTELSEVAISGDNMLFVKQPDAIQVGNQIIVAGAGISGHTERAVVEGKDGNEIELDKQLGFSYRPGAKVTVESIEATEALTDAPTPSPTLEPTESPTPAPTEVPLTGPPTVTTNTDTTTSATTSTQTTTTVTATSITTVF